MDYKVVLGLAALVMILGLSIYTFCKMSKQQKVANIKEWLKWAVSMAEKELGGGTGQLKLRQVYDMAISEFPWIVTFVDFEDFAGWVDEALDWMKVQLESNRNIAVFIQE